jgi:hypothetical protein
MARVGCFIEGCGHGRGTKPCTFILIFSLQIYTLKAMNRTGLQDVRYKDKAAWATCLSMLVLITILFLPSPANGHADPWGDLHPKVHVKNGNFEIHFNSSFRGQTANYTGRRSISSKVFSPDGKILSPRHQLPFQRSWASGGAVGLYGKQMSVGDTTFIFGSSRSEKPGYLMKTGKGKLTRHRLPWPKDVSLDLFEDVVATSDGMAISGKEDHYILKFYWFEHGADRPPVTFTIGHTYCIYNFPVASNIAYAGGRFWLAFMRSGRKNDAEEYTGQLVLWSWKPGDEKPREALLDSPVHWNCSLSMAAIGDRLCLAYHCATADDYYGGDARIFTVFKKAE